MFRYNSDHIVVGYIKQVLNTFNLPSYRVYTKKLEKYRNDTGKEHISVVDGLYIKENKIQQYNNGTWTDTLQTFGYNNKILNITKRLSISNNIYDTHTHEYLGNFLRFQRDYLGINLMPLYNCFSKNICNHLDIAINPKNPDGSYKLNQYTKERERNRHVFWSKDKEFTVYAIPVKFCQEYTIALDCTCGVEMCCGFYNDYLDELPNSFNELNVYHYWNNTTQQTVEEILPRKDLSQELANNTYAKYSDLRFNVPLLWSGVTENVLEQILTDLTAVSETEVDENSVTQEALKAKKRAYLQQLLKKERDLKLFIKIPVSNVTSIAVLEGDYREYNNIVYKPVTKTITTETVKWDEEQQKDIIVPKEVNKIVWERHQNQFITNYETVLLGEGKTKFDTVINTNPEVEDREFIPISPLQLLMFNTGESYPFADRLVEYLTGNAITAFDANTDNIRRVQKVMELNENSFALEGAWEGKMRNMLYDYMLKGRPTGEPFSRTICHDILGYVDKDVEKFYTAWTHEICRDKDGNFIPLTEREKRIKVDENGDPVKDENNNYIYEYVDVPLYREVTMPLTEADKKLLLEARTFLLMINDIANIPMYKEVYKPVCTISNVDLYEEEE